MFSIAREEMGFTVCSGGNGVIDWNILTDVAHCPRKARKARKARKKLTNAFVSKNKRQLEI
ncbi:hypothetical protein, partial [Methylovulum sp.]|uniref:hypothetical protein n=1 Tax=Methylovulum sp. TaxID=1916980 RepID=UPI002628C14B